MLAGGRRQRVGEVSDGGEDDESQLQLVPCIGVDFVLRGIYVGDKRDVCSAKVKNVEPTSPSVVAAETSGSNRIR